jgi:hypothetical protein
VLERRAAAGAVRREAALRPWEARVWCAQLANLIGCCCC